MRNTRTGTTVKKTLKITGSGILLALLFVLVFVGTLSGAFGIEENLQQNGIIQSNVADAGFSSTGDGTITTGVDTASDFGTYTVWTKVNVATLFGGTAKISCDFLMSGTLKTYAEYGFCQIRLTYKITDTRKNFQYLVKANDSNGAQIGTTMTSCSSKGTYTSSWYDISTSKLYFYLEYYGSSTDEAEATDIGFEIKLSDNLNFDGDGSSSNAFKLKNRRDFNILWYKTQSGNDFSDKYFKVEPESGTTIDMGSAYFEPIGDSTNKFKGHIDGNDSTIANLNISSGDYSGLFGYVEGGSITDLTLTNATVAGREYVGGLVGYANNATISGCSVSSGNIGTGGKISGDNNGYSIVRRDGYVPNSGENFDKLNDGDVTTKLYSDKNTVSFIIQVTDTSVPITGFAIANANDTEGQTGRKPTQILIWGKNENNVTGDAVGKDNAGAQPDANAGWTGVYANNGYEMPATNYYRKAFAFPFVVKYTYYWVHITSTSKLQLSEFELLTTQYTGGVIGCEINSTISDCTNSASVSGASYVGGVVGCAGNISASNQGGQMTSVSNSGAISSGLGTYVGGIAGYSRDAAYYGAISNSATISASTSSQVGGLWGYLFGNTKKSGSTYSNSGNVTGGNDTGGIAGKAHWATIDGATNSATVIGNDNVGGIAGLFYKDDRGSSNTLSGTLTNTGFTSGRDYVGGIVGKIDVNSIATSFSWTANVTNTGNSLTTGETDDGVRGRGYVGGAIGYMGANVTISGTITISNGNSGKAGDIDGYYTGADARSSYAVGGIVGYNAGTIGATMNVCARVLARGSGTVNDTTGAFAGGIVGYNAGTISGSASKLVGDILDVAKAGYAGGHTGYNGGTISGGFTHSIQGASDASYKVIDGGNYVGGVVGYNAGTLSIGAFTNVSTVGGKNYVGGIVGYISNSGMTLSSLANSGDITASGNGVGGIVGGMANGITLTIESCHNSGKITATSGNGVAGIIGYTGSAENKLSVSKCYNTGDVSAKQNVGGIGGRIETTLANGTQISFANCYNTGDITVTGAQNSSGNYVGGTVGGIVGYLYVFNESASASVGIVEYCYNSGKIYANNYVGNIGGIIGNPRAVNSNKDSVRVSYCYNEGLCTKEKHAYTDKNDNTTKYKTLYTYEISGTANANVEYNNIAIGSAVDTEEETNEFADIYNLTGEKSTTKASSLTYGGKLFAYGADLTVEPQVSLADTTNKRWEDILNENINGFKVYGTTSDGTYMSSLHNDNTDGTFANANTAVPSAVDNGGATANAVKSVGNSNCALTVTYKYGATYGKNLLVEIKNIAQDSKTREYCESSATLLKPSVPYIGTNGYSYLTLYYSNSDFSDNSAESKRDIGSYYTITDIIIDGKVVGRKTNTLIITAYDFESHFEKGEVWFGFNSNAIVSNQDLYTIDGTSYSLYLLNDSENENPHVLVYLNGNYYKIENVVIYYTAYWYWSEGTIQANTNDVNPLKTVKGCSYTYLAVENGKSVIRNNFTLPNFVSELNSGEHVRDGVQITASGQNNFTGSISRYYTLMDSDFSGNINQTNWGSASNPYIIENQAQLIRLSQIVNGAPAWNSININNTAVALAQNSNAVATYRTYEGTYFVIKGNLTLDSTYVPIGGVNDATDSDGIGNTTDNRTLKATRIEGYNNSTVTITYAYQNSDREYVGLFGKTRGTTIKNIIAQSNSTIKGKNYVGGLVGYAQDGAIENCSFISLTTAVGVEGISNVGGLVGRSGATRIAYNKSMTSGSHVVDANVKGVSSVGGIVGYWDMWNKAEYNGGNSLYFTNTRAMSIVGTGSYIGGIVGYLNVQKRDDTAGLSINAYLPHSGTGSITVSGNNFVGALFGAIVGNGADNMALNVNGYNVNVTVNGTSGGYVMGGLVGMVEKTSVVFNTSYNTSQDGIEANFNGSHFAGGLIGVVGEGANVRGQGTANGNTTTYPTLTSGSAVSGGKMTGGIIGYIAHTAGALFASSSTGTTTTFGASIWFVNSASVSGSAYVGGIVGGAGIINLDTGIDELTRLLKYGTRSKASSAVVNTMVFEPSVARNTGKVSSTASGTSGGTGGILGYAGSNVRVNLVGATISLNTQNVNNYTFNIYNSGAIEGNYAGGIVGYLGDGSHTLQYLVNYGTIGKNAASYVGGIVGYMIGGEIANCVSAPNSNDTSISTSLSQYLGSSNVGGLVGYMQGGTLKESISGGFNFASNSSTKGGVVGGVVNPNIEGAWAIYFASNPTYQSVSANTNGKYVVIDSSAVDMSSVAELKHIFVMAGIIATDKSGYTYNNYTFKKGELLIGVNIPSGTKQLAFYNVSGSDVVMDTPLVKLESKGTILSIGVNMVEGKSFSICKTDVKFGTIAKYTGGNATDGKGTTAGKTNAAKGYQAPSGAEYVEGGTGYYYTIEVNTATYDSDGNISSIEANIYFNGTLVASTSFKGEVGKYSNTFEAGSEASPYVISTQEEWNDFAYSIYSGAKDYSGEYVKLNTDITIEKKDSHQGTNNTTYNFYQNEWTLIYNSESNGFTIGDGNNTDYTTSVNSSTAYKYYWVYMEGGSGGLQLSKFKINGLMSYTVMASKSADTSGSEKFQNIFSDNTNKYYNARKDASFSVKFDSATTLNNFTITNAGDNTNSSGVVLNRTVSKIKIWGTNNAVNASSENDHAVESAKEAGFGNDGKSAGSNIGYNFAGNIEQGEGNMNKDATIVASNGGTAVTPSFKGHFDGNGHKITVKADNGDYYHRMSTFPNAGGNTDGNSTTFKNLTITGNIIAGNSNPTNTPNGNERKLSYDAAYDLAGFVGKPFGPITFENCINDVNIKGLRVIGGFAGVSTSSATIELIGCVNKGNITSFEGSTFSKGTLQNVGNTDDYQYGTGGLIGYATSAITFESCLNTGNITAPVKAGGLLGRISGSGEGGLVINNCANTGNITSTEYNLFCESDNTEKATNVWSRVGGLVGEIDQDTGVNAYASYNTGHIKGYGNLAGGLFGIIGSLPDGEKAGYTVSKVMSNIAYCYNTGKVEVGYMAGQGMVDPGGSGNNFNGSNAGGIVGTTGAVTISYCYNTGEIYAKGGVGYSESGMWLVNKTYHTRDGGIIGEFSSHNNNDNLHTALIYNCYNIGKILIAEKEKASDSSARYGADIIGYLGHEVANTELVVENCYGIKGNIQIGYGSGKDDVLTFNGWNQHKNDGDVKWVRTGTTLNSLTDLTAALESDGTIKTTSYTQVDGANTEVNLWSTGASTATIGAQNQDAYKNGTLGGYIYVWGCLPQLAVFAVDTYNGLSMNSVSYGQNTYGEYVRQNSGEQFSPYVIKDGIDLLGMQALVSLGYSFENEYIEIADGTNNISTDTELASANAEIITLPSQSTRGQDGDLTSSDSTYGKGKNYHLYKLGALCSDDPFQDENYSDNQNYIWWLGHNYYYDGTSGAKKSNSNYSNQNFLPIGKYGQGYNSSGANASYPFSGSFDGRGALIKDVNMPCMGEAGLFAYVKDATIKNIKVSGTISAYSYEENNATTASAGKFKTVSVAGGIVARASGNTTVSGCSAGATINNETFTLTVRAYGKKTAYESSYDDKVSQYYAGGIVGVADTSGTEEGTTVTIDGNTVTSATIQTRRGNVGGIVGYAYDNANSNSKNHKAIIKDNHVDKADIYAMDLNTSNASTGTDIGGIIGSSNASITVIARDNVVGINSTSTTVNIYGENSVGGIMGSTPDAVNEIAGGTINPSVNIQRRAYGEVTNAGDSGTAIGGIVGRTAQGSGEQPITTTFSGKITFNGNINVALQTVYAENGGDSKDGAVLNIGGIVGDMGAGARIASGANITVTGYITITASIDTNHTNRNIGGVAGRADDVAFSGTFDVRPYMQTTNQTVMQAYNVGGFIGKNNGIIDILADNTDITIGGTISGLHDVGGFIGYNAPGQTLRVGADYYRGVSYNSTLKISVSNGANITASGDNVGGIVGNNAIQDTKETTLSYGHIEITKGEIENSGNVNGANAVGGIIGLNSGALSTGGSAFNNATLSITNKGNVSGNMAQKDGQYTSGMYVGGVIGKLNQGTIAGNFANTGYVSGSYFVGGSIGYVDYNATITAIGSDTTFTNGAVATASGDAMVADDNAVASSQTHNVEGVNYVGGSLGYVAGTIRGTMVDETTTYKVIFTSNGTFDGKKYVGGSIGVLAGVSQYAEFISSADATTSADTAVGGSVGFIGMPSGIYAQEKNNLPSTYSISIKNTHFEAGGILTVNGTKSSNASDWKWGGVGGAIGAIGNSTDNNFSGGANWADNTYYAGGNVSASNLAYVGGIVGLIKADNIEINNMLAYDTTVTGYNYVGGIVGATCGANTVIDSAYSISTSDTTGMFTATVSEDKNNTANGIAGGIIGLANSTTNASTSYWVKGYSNEQLAGSNVSNLQNTLGRFTLVSESFTGESGSTVNVVFTKELIGTPTTSEDAIYPTPYAYYESVGKHAVGGKNYSIDADDVGYTTISSTLTWSEYFALTQGTNKVKFSDIADNWVKERENWTGYSTGTEQTGWYFVYANDTTVGTVNVVHASSGSATDKDYWKRIANAYTAQERATGADTKTLSSQIVQDTSKSGVVNGGSPDGGVLYATATGATQSGYYMYIATSNSAVKPSAIHSTIENKFFIKVNTNANTQTSAGATVSLQAQNVAVYYRSVAMGSSLTYNGYERYAPISLQSDIVYNGEIDDTTTDETKANTYYYNGSNTAKDPGTYTSDVKVFYFDDLGKAYVVGGITSGTWKINKRKLMFSATSVTNKTYGDEDINITVTVTNISPADTSIDFNLTISGDKLTTINVNLVNGKVNNSETYTSQDIKISAIAVSQNGTQSLNGTDARFNVSEEQGLVTNKLSFVVNFKDAKDYKVALNTTSNKPSANYMWEDENETTVSVKPAVLTIKRTGGSDSVQFDNNTHDITWSIDGFKFNENLEKIVALNPEVHVNIEEDKNYTESLINNGSWVSRKDIHTMSNTDNTRASTIKLDVKTSTNTIKLSGAKLHGEYYLTFANTADNCNYTFNTTSNTVTSPKLSIGKNKLTVSWAASSNKTYDTKTTEISAIVTADKEIDNIETFVKDYFKSTITDNGAITYTVTTDKKVVKISFTTGKNAKTYKAELTYDNKISKVECAYEGALTRSLTINPKSITVTEEWTADGGTSHEYTYTSYHQGLAKITVSGVLNSDEIIISLTGALTASKTMGNGEFATSGTIDTNELVGNNNYIAELKLGNSSYPSKNYYLEEDITYKWTIKPVTLPISISGDSIVTYDAKAHKPTVSINGTTVYNNTYSFGQDTISVNYKAGDLVTQAFVNAETYEVKIDTQAPIKATRGGADVSKNYNADASGNAIYKIEKRHVTVVWSSSPINGFVYSGKEQGLSVVQLQFTGSDGKTSSNLGSNTFTGYGNDKLVVYISDGKTDVGSDYTMQYDSHALSESCENEGVRSTKDNYIFDGGLTSSTFDIVKSQLAISHSSGSISKEYDGGISVNSLNGLSFDVTTTNNGVTTTSSAFEINATFTDRHVGSGKTIKFTYALKSEYTKNYAYEPVSNIEQKNIGSIYAKTITVQLDILRNGKATRTYNGGVFYGGENGASASAQSFGASKSAIYRSGEGFTVSGWYSVDDASIVAKYIETDKERSQFDSYVNNVYVDGGVYKNDGTFYKKLQFSIIGENAGNYLFVVCNGSGEQYNQTAASQVDVFDKRDTDNNKSQNLSDIQIEITVKSIRVTYANTMQSYVNDDNTYNTEWLDVTGENKETDKAGAEIEVVNGWKNKEGGYKSYTVIRGSANSSQLGAKIKGGSGMEFNFRLSNQPILTIGYFVNSDNNEMQISSLADLLIASFYWTASQKTGDSDFENFMKIIQSGYDWVIVATQNQYDNGVDVPDGYESWDDYFEHVENEYNAAIFFNDEENAWGYYKAIESSNSQIFTSYKQIADIDGTFTQRDIELLSSFFTSVEVDENGNSNTVPYEWGLGKTYLDNIINPGVGNVAVAIGSIFKSKDAGFTGSYDGNGYVIEYFNIMSFDADANVGMFDVIGTAGTVKNLHLRNITISASGASSNVGGIAGKAMGGSDDTANTSVENVTWHGSISMTADGNVGGLFGYASKDINNAIALGTITAKGGNIGGLIGSIEGASMQNAVSFVYVEASGNVSATAASVVNGADMRNVTYLDSSAWKRSGSSLVLSEEEYGSAKTYTDLMKGSTSGYVEGSEYYLAKGRGEYDVIDETDLSQFAQISTINARQSMRLKDIVDVYMLMFDITQESVNIQDSANVGMQQANVYKISESSWLVGEHHGTDDDRIVIANKQNVSLLRELRFASFVLVADVEAQSTSGESAYSGAFFGNVSVESGKNYKIDFGTAKSVFEAIVRQDAPFKVATA